MTQALPAATRARLAATDEDDEFDVYDARVGGVAASLQPRTACSGEACQPLPVAVGRPSLTPDHESQPVLGSSLISANLPLFWFIEPTNGDVQFCAPRHPGVCVRMKMPR